MWAELGCSAACGIFPDQGSNPCPLHWQADSQPLRHQGSPIVDILNISSHFAIWQLILCVISFLEYKVLLFIYSKNFLPSGLRFSSCVLKKAFLTHVTKICTYIFFYWLHDFVFHTLVSNPTDIYHCIWCFMKIQFSFYPHEKPVFPTTSTKLSILTLFDLWYQLYCVLSLHIWALSLSSLFPWSVCSCANTSPVLIWWLWGRS